jgi:DNA-binding transcriptional ArsR family regulator
MSKKQRVNNIFKALADPTRRELFHMLVVATSAMSLTQMAEEVNMTRQGVTKHIELLENAGMIKSTEQGRERFCHANLGALNEIRDWLAFYDRFWDDSLKRLDSFLAGKSKGRT